MIPKTLHLGIYVFAVFTIWLLEVIQLVLSD